MNRVLEQLVRKTRAGFGWSGVPEVACVPEVQVLERPGAPPGKLPENVRYTMPAEARENRAGSTETWEKLEDANEVQPSRSFEMNLERVGETDWPTTTPVSPAATSR